MAIPRDPFLNRSLQFTNATAATPFTNPIGWVQMVVAGNLVMTAQNGVSVSYTNIPAGAVIPGPFAAFTSTTSTQILLGDGPPPPPIPPASLLASTTAGNGSATVGSSDVGGYYTGTTVEAQLQEIGLALTSAQGVIPLPPPAAWSLLADGAPMAVWANGATTVPGTYSDGAKVGGCARWNNDAAPAAIVTCFDIPPDMDVTADAVVHFRVAKTGATNNAGNTTTITCIAANQVDGALYDADTNFGGASSALLPAATAKTIQNLTRTLALADLAAYPASVTLSAKPTAGTLDTDDLVFLDAYVVYQKKILTA